MMQRLIVRRTARLATILFPLLMIAGPVSAQQVIGARAGIIQYVEGEAFLEGNSAPPSSTVNHFMENGHSLSTKRGRVELLLTPNAYLRLGENGSLRMEQNKLNDIRMELEQGSALIEIVRQFKGNRTRVRIAGGVVELKRPGLYRLDAGSRELRVYGGEALVASGNRRIKIKRDKMLRLEGRLESLKFDANAADALHMWAAQRSFNLFIATEESRKQLHWTPIALGWLHNSNYRMRFYSQMAFGKWTRDQSYQEKPEREQASKARMDSEQAERAERMARVEEEKARALEAARAAEEAARAGAGQGQTPAQEPPK